MRRFARFILCTLLLSSFLLQALPVLAASTRLVSTTGSDSGDCTASPCATIAYAYTQSATGDTISVAAGTYTETSGYDITKNVTISGAGAMSTIVQAAASAGIANHRFYKVNGSGITVNIQNLTLRYGVDASGGALNVAAGTLNLTNVILSDNQVNNSLGTGLNGGALSVNGGTLTINNSTISNNSVTTNDATSTVRGSGGAIFLGSTGTVTLNNTTVSGNSSIRGGGGLFTNGGTININYSTIANNTSDNTDATALTSVDGGGINRSSGTINLKSSIVAGNKKGISSPTDSDCSGTITSQGYNLTGSSTGCSLAGTGDVTVTPSTVFTSVLGPLANNGGQTSTHLLYGGNAAKDSIPSGTNSCGSGSFATDQLSNTRPFNTSCDMGAYESQDAAPTVSISSTASNPTTTSPIPVIVTFSESVTGFTSGDITPGNASVSNFAGSGSSFSFDLTPSSEGTVTADIVAGVAQDVVHNANSAATQFSRSYDATAPTVTLFTATSPTNSLNIAIAAFTASDSVGVTGYLITESSTPPSAGAAGWTASAPTTYAVASAGSYTLYPWAKDATSHVSAVYGSPASVTVDTTAPTVTSITRVGSNPTNASSVDFMVIFSESSLTGVDTSDFALTTTGGISGASVTSVSSTGAARTVTVNTGTGDGTIRLDVSDDDTIADAAGNKLGGAGTGNGHFTSGETYTLDQTSPAVVLSSSATDPTSTSIPVTVTFSESVTGFTAGDITLGNATVGNFAGSGTTYTFDLIPAGNGLVTADIAAGVAQDAAGNGNTAAAQFSRTYDATAPSVTSFSATSPSASLNIPITAFTASDAVGVTGYLITASATPPSAGAAGWAASAPATYTVAGDGAYTLYPWAKDAAGNVSAVFGSPASVSVETTAPSVVSSVRVNTSPTNAASLDFIVTFSESVSGVDASDFSLVTGTGLPGASVTGVSGGPKVYTVSVNTGSGSGTMRLDVLDDDSIIDTASNPLGGTGPANGGFSAGQLYTIDKTAPTAGSLVAAKVTTAGSTTYRFTVVFSDNLAIDSTSLDGSDIRVTGPGGFSQLATLVGVTPAGNGAPRTATYQITAPGGAWDTLDNGSYTIAVEANQSFDTAGNSVGATSLGSFLVSLSYTVDLPLVQR